MSLDQRLAAAMKVHNAATQKMFGSVCYMVNGNMTVCVSKHGLLVRSGPDQFEVALKLPGTRAAEMGGKKMMGYVRVDEAHVPDRLALEKWINMALVFNKTLPEKKKK